jgi:uncharacterized protein (TIGR02145 family)
MNSKLNAFVLLLLFCSLISVKPISAQVTDKDGHTYKTLKIGTQEWLSENLNVGHYLNGDPIPQVQDSAAWSKLKTGAWCYYNYKSGDHVVKGKLYNYYAIEDKRGLLPEGFKIADAWDDWKQVAKWLHEGISEYSGDDTSKIRQFMGADLQTQDCWKNKSYYREGNGHFGSLSSIGFWWLPGDKMDMTYTFGRCTGSDGAYFGYAEQPDWKNYGFAIRCYKDIK